MITKLIAAITTLEAENAALWAEIDEALMLAEGPSSLKDLAAMSFERGQRMCRAEESLAALRAESAALIQRLAKAL